MEQPYIDVIVEGVLSTTLWNFTTDAGVFAMQAFGGFDMKLAFFCAVLGASIGSFINYGLGRMVSACQFNGLSAIPQEKYDRWRRYGTYAIPVIGLLSWIHLLGALVFALGFLRVKALYVLPLLIAGQAAYYGYYLL